MPAVFPGATDEIWQQNEHHHTLNTNAYADEHTLDVALIEEFLSLLDDGECIEQTRDAMLKYGAPTFLTAYGWAHTMWGSSDPVKNIRNLESLAAPWQANGGIARLVKCMQHCTEYA